MKKILVSILFFYFLHSASAQPLLECQYKNIEALDKDLQQAKTPEQKANALTSLYLHHAQHSNFVIKYSAIKYQQELEIYVHETKAN